MDKRFKNEAIGMLLFVLFTWLGFALIAMEKI